MRRNLIKSQLTAKKMRPRAMWRIGVTAVLFVLTVGGFAYGFYQYYQRPERFPALSSLVHRASDWFQERKHHLQKDLDNKAQDAKSALAKQDDTEPQVHFEFYSMLPNMQMSEQVKPAPTSVASSTPVSAPVSAPNAALFSQDELEQDFSRHMTHKSYASKDTQHKSEQNL